MQTVEVWIKGHLDLQWSEWLDGFTLTHTEQGETILTGQVNDQAAVYGLIFKLRDLGVCLIRVEMK
jgi:hypothetical protein